MPNGNRQATPSQNLLWFLRQAAQLPKRTAETVGEAFSSAPFLAGMVRQDVGEALYNYPLGFDISGKIPMRETSEKIYPDVEAIRKRTVAEAGLTPGAQAYYRNVPMFYRPEKEQTSIGGSSAYNPARNLARGYYDEIFKPEHGNVQKLLDPVPTTVAAAMEGHPWTSNIREKYIKQLMPGSVNVYGGKGQNRQKVIFHELTHQSPVPRFKDKKDVDQFELDFQRALNEHPSVKRIMKEMAREAGMDEGTLVSRMKKYGHEELFVRLAEQLGPKARDLPYVGKYYKPLFTAKAAREWQPYPWSIYNPENVRDSSRLPPTPSEPTYQPPKNLRTPFGSLMDKQTEELQEWKEYRQQTGQLPRTQRELELRMAKLGARR